jgi:outer membrane protein OmpA-like peptidoglycan-associated protein
MKLFGFLGIFCFVFPLAGQPVDQPRLLVNTPYDELNPVVAPDGRTLFITIANHPENIGGKKDPGDIWISTLTATDQWSAPVHGGAVINNAAFNGVAGFSADGHDIFLLSHYASDGSLPRTQGIAVAHRNGDGWSRPENIVIPYFQNKSSILSGHILPDQSVFVFSAETYGTRGVDDLYVTVKGSDGKWSEPKNLGSAINTQFQEMSPSLTADGTALYFSSNGRKGSGSFDVYFTTRLDNSWTNWSTPLHVAAVNSEGRDLYYRQTPDPYLAVYASTKNSDGYGDIRLYRQADPRPDSLPVARTPVDSIRFTEVDPDLPGHDHIRVYGTVTNAKTGEVIPARVNFAAPSKNQVVTADNAGYNVMLPVGNAYVIKIEAQGFVSTMERLEVDTDQMNVLEMNFRLQPVEAGTTVNLRNVLFEQGKTVMLPQSYPELDLIVNFLQANPKVTIELSGHTDNRGIPSQNLKLSKSRVEKVKSYLVSKGIDRRRVSGKGYGGARPIASNDNEETRQLNRRVEFTIKKF